MIPEKKFIEELFEYFYIHSAVLLLSQEGRTQPSNNRTYILERAKKQFGEKNVFHIVVPKKNKGGLNDFFSNIGNQLNISDSVDNSLFFLMNFEKILKTGKTYFLLIDEFDDGFEEARLELAGLVRILNERYLNIKILICGGELLADLYYTGKLSFLNNAEYIQWPEYTVKDVIHIFKKQYESFSLNIENAEKLLEFCGGNPLILNEILDLFYNFKKFDSFLFNNAINYSLLFKNQFVSLLNNCERNNLCQFLLKKEEVGYYTPYIYDPVLKGLYWKNLVKTDQKKLIWRCNNIRLAGLQIIGC